MSGDGAEPPLDPARLELDADVLWVLHCAEGPIPRSAADAVRSFLDRELRPWTLRWDEDLEGIPAATRCAAARVLGGVPSDVALTESTSSALQIVARGLEWRRGDEVVVPLGEFPSNLWPWKALERRGVVVREVPLWSGHRAGAGAFDSIPPDLEREGPEERLLYAVGPRTRLVAASWVRFQDGLVLDLPILARGCRERGIPLVVDGIQGAGVLPVPLEGLAAFAAGGHKGLLAPQGLALLWTSPAFREELLPRGTWLQVEDSSTWSRPSTDHERDWFHDGRRLESGVPNLLGAVALRESLEWLAEAGVERVAEHVAALRRRLLRGLSDRGTLLSEVSRLRRLDEARRLGPIVALHRGPGGDWAGVLREGRRRGIVASAREGYLRIALHGWHTMEDVDRVAGWIAETSHDSADRKTTAKPHRPSRRNP